jgi:hypothetical protein
LNHAWTGSGAAGTATQPVRHDSWSRNDDEQWRITLPFIGLAEIVRGGVSFFLCPDFSLFGPLLNTHFSMKYDEASQSITMTNYHW